MPSLRQLQYLVALNELGHFRLAAEKVGVSQPTLSGQFLALEQRLGVTLVERNRTPIVLTSAGRQILPLALRITQTMTEIAQVAKNHRQDMSDIVRLGLPPTVGPYLLPLLLPVLHQKYPKLRISVREDFSSALPDGLASGVHDLLITPLPVRGKDFTTRRLFREPLFLAVPLEHQFAKLKSINPDDLQGQSVLALEAGHALHEQVHSLCQEFGANILFEYEGTSLNTLLQMVGMGLGVTFLPGLFVRKGIPAEFGVKILTLNRRQVSRVIGLVWRTSSTQEKTFERIAAHIYGVVGQDLPDFPLLDQTHP